MRNTFIDRRHHTPKGWGLGAAIRLSILILFLGQVYGQTPKRVPSAFYPGPGKSKLEAAEHTLPPSLRSAMTYPVEVPLGPLSASELSPGETGPMVIGVHRSLEKALERVGAVVKNGATMVPGAWSRTSEGSLVWRLSIRSPGAVAVRMHFENFSVGAGEVWIHTGQPEPSEVKGPYSGRGLYKDRDFWSGMVFDETLIVEYVPAWTPSEIDAVPFVLTEISHIWSRIQEIAEPDKSGLAASEKQGDAMSRSLKNDSLFQMLVDPAPRFATDEALFVLADPCHLDPSCYPEWKELATAVAKIVFEKGGRTYYCSGTMLMDYDATFTPYFLTAGHCITDNSAARTAETYWFYQTNSCNGPPPLTHAVPSVEGASYLVGRNDDDGDYSLLELTSAPEEIWFSGWDSSPPTVGQRVATIHHPVGDFKRITFGSALAKHPLNAVVQEYFLTVRQTEGKTQRGSSGSGVFYDHDYLIGVLSSGTVAPPGLTVCNVEPFYDNFTRFSVVYPEIQPYIDRDPGHPIQTPDLTISKSLRESMSRGDESEYRIRVTNVGSAPTTGVVTVTDVLPVGLTATSFNAYTGWSCSVWSKACSRSDPLMPGESYPDIGLRVRIRSDAQSPVTNKATVSGGGDTNLHNNEAIHTSEVQGQATSGWLISGVPVSFQLPAVSSAGTIFLDSQYKVQVPESAGELEVHASTSDPTIQIDLLGRYGAPVVMDANGIPITDQTTFLKPDDTLTFTPASTPPLRAGTYYIAFRVWTTGRSAQGAITATITSASGTAPKVHAVVSAASYEPKLAPGSIGTIFGADLTRSAVSAESMPLPRQLGGVRVEVSGLTAPLFYVSPNQINFQVPFETPLGETLDVRVFRDGVPSIPASVRFAEYAAGIFTYGGTREPVIVNHATGKLVTPAEPAKPGDTLIIYGTGIGGLTNLPATGEATPASPLAEALVSPNVTIGEVPAEVLFAGLGPYYVGVAQFNIRLPGALPPGNRLPLVIRFGPSASPEVRLCVEPDGGPVVDFAVELREVSPTEVSPGDALTLRYTVFNPSGFEGGGSRKLYISTNPTISPSTDRYINTRTFTLTGKDGGFISRNNLVPDLTSGTYYVGIVIDVPGDSNPANNASNSLPIHVTGPVTCNYSISPNILHIGASGGDKTLSVTAPAGCPWTASVNFGFTSWISILSGASGTGSGVVHFRVAENTSTSSRTGYIAVQGQSSDQQKTLTIEQNGRPCSYAISPTSSSISYAGGTGTVNVTTSTGCAWTATSNNSWIAITSGSSRTGSGTASYSVAANPTTSARTGTMTIAGQTFTVNQPAPPQCTYSISPTSQSFDASGGTGAVTVTASSASCSWTTTSHHSWITITSGSTGTGSGTVSYSVTANTSSARTGAMTVAGHTFNVNQAGGGIIETVTWSLSLPSVTVSTLFYGDYSRTISVPADATRLTVELSTMTPGADVDLYLRYGTDVALSGGRPVADHFSEGLTGYETITVTPTSSPHLRTGTYYIATAVFTTGTPIQVTITATTYR